MRRSLMALATALVTALALASGSAFAAGSDSAAGDEPRGAFDHAVALSCRSLVGDRGPAVECGWRADHDLEIAAWRLWKVRIRPEAGGRTLVAELRPDESGYTDADVVAPAVYLYVVVGVDGEGEVVARSRPDLVRAGETPRSGMPLACHLRRGADVHAADRAAVEAATSPPAPTIACRWGAPDGAHVRGYVVHRSVDGAEREVVAEVGADVTLYVDHEVGFGHRYAYVVSALDGEGHVVARTRVATVGVPPWPSDQAPDRSGLEPGDGDVELPIGPITDGAADRRAENVTDGDTDRSVDRAADDRGWVRPDRSDAETPERATADAAAGADGAIGVEALIAVSSGGGVEGIVSAGSPPADR